jgi:5,10-methenyltetrahydrofolate synthetase
MERAEIMAWRKAERERLIAARLAVPADRRMLMAEAIAAGIDTVAGVPAGRVASFYWPFRGEPDLRPWAQRFAARGGRTALPIVVEKGRPLIFRTWRQGEPLGRGVWNIPIPEGGDEVVPDIVIAPLVGFDPQRYRLGYGGGFFDRTLASLPTRPLVIGIGYAMSRLETIHPLPHDIAMSVIVTEAGVQAG